MTTNMSPSPARTALIDSIVSFNASEDSIRQRFDSIQRELLTTSPYVRELNFQAIHSRDLEFLFHAYDAQFLNGLMTETLGARRLTFRPAPRMTKAGGK